MSTAARLPATEMTTTAAKTTSPVRPNRACARQGRECVFVRRDPGRRHQVEEHRADGDVDDRDDRHAQHQSTRQGAPGVADLARDLAHVPPARERDERPDQGTGQGRNSGSEPGRCDQNGVRFDQSPSAEREAPDHEKAQQAELQCGQVPRTPRAERNAEHVDRRPGPAIAPTATALSPQGDSGTR